MVVLHFLNRLLSSYDMLQRFVELKPYLDQLSASMPDIVIPLGEWNLLMDMADSLKPLKMAIIRLTSKDVPVSEFYKIWITSFLKTKKIGKKNQIICSRWLIWNKIIIQLYFQELNFHCVYVRIWINEKAGYLATLRSSRVCS